MIHELPLEDLWPFVRHQFAQHPVLWALLRLNGEQFFALQRLARTEGQIPTGPAWEPIPPDEAARMRAELEERERRWIQDRPIREQWMRDHPDRVEEAAWIREHREEAAAGPARAPQRLPERRLRPGQPLEIVRDGEVLVELPSNGHERAPEPPPRGRPGAPKKLTDEVLRQHLLDHPDLTHAQRARMLTRHLDLQEAPLHRQTIASRVRALKTRSKKAP